MEVVVKIFGSEYPCTRCRAAEDVVMEVAREFGERVKVVKLPFLSEEAIKYGISAIPSVVVNDEVVSLGAVPSRDELRKAIARAMVTG